MAGHACTITSILSALLIVERRPVNPRSDAVTLRLNLSDRLSTALWKDGRCHRAARDLASLTLQARRAQNRFTREGLCAAERPHTRKAGDFGGWGKIL
ncbi:MAG: hypothetical protein ACREB2_11860 [Pseudolabrys sp.]